MTEEDTQGSLKVVVIHQALLGHGVTKDNGFEGGSQVGDQEATEEDTLAPLMVELHRPGWAGLLF